MSNQRLLILACSQRKDPASQLLPALDRYNGPTYQVLRRYARQGEALPLTFSLSAEFGLIRSDALIPLYDRRMTPSRATQLLPVVTQSLQHVAAAAQITEVLICAGQDYLAALADVERVLTCPAITYANGPLGRQATMLYSWLRHPVTQLLPAPPPARATGSVKFKGSLITLTPAEILQLADEQAALDQAGASRYEGWYVATGRTRVAPKWLISTLTGVPVGKFRTADALALLTRLGVDVTKKY